MRVPWPAARTTTAATSGDRAGGAAAADSCAITDLLRRTARSALGDSDSNRDCTAPKAGGLPITPSPTRGTAVAAHRGATDLGTRGEPRAARRRRHPWGPDAAVAGLPTLS